VKVDRTETRTIPLERIHPNPNNPRSEAGDVTELADQIESEGQLYDALVVPAPRYGPDHYELFDGYRRYVAMMHRGYEEMDCKVLYPAAGTNLIAEATFVGLITSTGKPLNSIERAKAYGTLVKQGLTPQEIADRIGRSLSAVTRAMELLDLAPKTQQAVIEKKLSVGDAHKLVTAHRQSQRKQQGHKPAGTVWEPPYFSENWALANRAVAMCRGLRHSVQRPVWKGGPCGRCVELTIRMDQDEIRRITTDSSTTITFQTPTGGPQQ